jgi:hypothetical protein
MEFRISMCVMRSTTPSLAIETLELLEGSLPKRALALAHEWAELHRSELMENWQRARDKEPLQDIDPLP